MNAPIAITPCQSSQLAGYGYNAATRTLAVQFPGRGPKPGDIYHYSDFSPESFAALEAAKSKGEHFGIHIRGKFAYEKQPGPDGVAFGLQSAQEPKYTVSQKDGRIVNRATGKPIPDDEPIFILRAKDMNATHALHAYWESLDDEAHAAEVEARMEAFDAFAEAHPERMKQPDTAAA